MKIWLVGGSGMLGQALAEALSQHGLDHAVSGQAVDVTDRAALARYADCARPTHVINCAALAHVDACEAEGERAQQINGEGPGHIAQVAAARGLPVLHVSTDYVFAGDGNRPYEEDDPVGPINAYGRTKAAGEAAFWAAAPGPAAYVVRTSWLFGHGGRHFVGTMLRLMAEHEEVRVVADQVGRPTYCADLAAALLLLMGLTARPAAAAGTYHVANTGAVSWHGLAQATWAGARHLGLPLRCRRVTPVTSAEVPRPARRPAYSVLSSAKFTGLVGTPLPPWENALSRHLMREHAPDRRLAGHKTGRGAACAGL